MRSSEPGSPLRNAWFDLGAARITVPTFSFGGWADIFGPSTIMRTTAIPLPPAKNKIVIGYSYHANPGTGFGNPGQPPGIDVLQLAWFDKWLEGIDNGIDTYGPVVMKEFGGGRETLDRYPQPGMTYQRMYLSAVRSDPAGRADRGLLARRGHGIDRGAEHCRFLRARRPHP